MKDMLIKDLARQIRQRRFTTPKAVALTLGTSERFVRYQLRLIFAYLQLIPWGEWSQYFSHRSTRQ